MAFRRAHSARSTLVDVVDARVLVYRAWRFS